VRSRNMENRIFMEEKTNKRLEQELETKRDFANELWDKLRYKRRECARLEESLEGYEELKKEIKK